MLVSMVFLLARMHAYLRFMLPHRALRLLRAWPPWRTLVVAPTPSFRLTHPAVARLLSHCEQEHKRRQWSRISNLNDRMPSGWELATAKAQVRHRSLPLTPHPPSLAARRRPQSLPHRLPPWVASAVATVRMREAVGRQAGSRTAGAMPQFPQLLPPLCRIRSKDIQRREESQARRANLGVSAGREGLAVRLSTQPTMPLLLLLRRRQEALVLLCLRKPRTVQVALGQAPALQRTCGVLWQRCRARRPRHRLRTPRARWVP